MSSILLHLANLIEDSSVLPLALYECKVEMAHNNSVMATNLSLTIIASTSLFSKENEPEREWSFCVFQAIDQKAIPGLGLISQRKLTEAILVKIYIQRLLLQSKMETKLIPNILFRLSNNFELGPLILDVHAT